MPVWVGTADQSWKAVVAANAMIFTHTGRLHSVFIRSSQGAKEWQLQRDLFIPTLQYIISTSSWGRGSLRINSQSFLKRPLESPRRYAQKQVSPERSGMFEARGCVVGEILHLGPTYSDFISSPNAERKWKQSFGIHYTTPRAHESCYWWRRVGSQEGSEYWRRQLLRL